MENGTCGWLHQHRNSWISFDATSLVSATKVCFKVGKQRTKPIKVLDILGVSELMNTTMEAITEVEETLSELRQTFKSGRTRSVAWRKNQVSALLQLIHDQEDKIFKALYEDLGKHPAEAYRDEVDCFFFFFFFYLFFPFSRQRN